MCRIWLLQLHRCSGEMTCNEVKQIRLTAALKTAELVYKRVGDEYLRRADENACVCKVRIVYVVCVCYARKPDGWFQCKTGSLGDLGLCALVAVCVWKALAQACRWPSGNC